ncbi:nitroreductase/quinone reductase family protein [Georgenia muralis]|uniref:Deazaflavin-dependent oxidoreductase (Nitroreductase family) n=1 Tax=Georgenia muralis TaxID=154117 RepID=A0A3N4ZCC8_9MICO|nr:nitroreductase/quinone reductase family protein [Georgenia muralis]RPF28970.1 deazaflavin-dependent oxidoreductase (nitroreductase family) [Georgenia muralis]
MNAALSSLLRTANTLAVALYRRPGGRIGGSAKGVPVLLLTVPGRRTPDADSDTVPVAYFLHDGGFLVTGSNGGSSHEPQWFRNIRATTTGRVEIGRRGLDVDVRVTAPDDGPRRPRRCRGAAVQ